MPRTTPALALAVTTILAGPPHAPPDLDVGIPPGSPTQWGQRFPAITPRDQPLFPLTGNRGPRADEPRRTVVQDAVLKLEVQIADTFGIVRILTWDVGAHVRWVNVPDRREVPITGAASFEAPLPEAGKGLHWTTAAALLRLLLHPQLVSEKELVAHLVEIGEPALAMVAAARVEPALTEICRDLEARIAVDRRAARPLPGADPRNTMLSRFVHDELVATFPYDPEGGFGRRMFLFSEEVEPILIAYAAHEDSLLRRNAVAALGRYRTSTASHALLGRAVQPADPVAQMRALASMVGGRALLDPAALLRRLQLSKDPVEQVALIQALGRVGLRGAVPTLLELGSKRDVDPDLLLAVVTALVGIRHARDPEDLVRFADRLVARTKNGPTNFRVGREKPSPAADRPDTGRTRAEVLGQLALLLQVRVRPSDTLVEQVLAMGSLSGVHPPAQMLFLETLRDLGPPGIELLETVAADRSVEPALRGRALALLPPAERGSLAVEILQSGEESDEAKIYAVEVLGVDGHHRLRELAVPLLADCAEVGEAPASPERRYLWLSLLRALERHGLLETADLLPLLARVAAARNDRSSVSEMIEGMVERLVADTAAGISRGKLRERIDEILAPVVEHGMNDLITSKTVGAARDHVVRQLQGLRGRRNDTAYHGLVAETVLRYLLGFRVDPAIGNNAVFAPIVLLEEEILLALGRSGSPAAATALATFLQEQSDNPFRAHACLALGATGSRELARHLVPYLVDEDGFVGFCAYESLRHLTGQDFWADWMYGELGERGAAAEQWFRWTNRRR